MSKKASLSFSLLLLQLLIPTLWVSGSAQEVKINISTPEQIANEFKEVPCKDEERLNAVKALFEKAGATPSEVSIVKYKNVENLVVLKRGASEEKIVVGAHYDKVSDGCGAVDNWTGIVTLVHLYKTLKEVPIQKTILFVAFGKEEKGLIGSAAMAGSISKDQVKEYCAMINIDSLGLGAPQVARNMSSIKLEEAAARLAKDMKMRFFNASIEGADSDSSSFIKKGIPALTIHGLTNEWSSILHSGKDQPAKVNSDGVYLGYRLALALLATVNETPCGSFR